MNRQLRGIICTLIGATCWGFSGVCGQYLFKNYEVNSNWLTCVRMVCSGVLLIVFEILRNKKTAFKVFGSIKDGMVLFIFSIFGLMLCQYSYLTAIEYSNAGTATVLQYLGLVLIMIVTCVIYKRLPKLRELLAMIFALFGTFLLVTHFNINTLSISEYGLFWGLMAAVGMCLYSMIPMEIIKKYGSMTITGFGMLIGGIVLCCTVRVWKINVNLDLKGIIFVIAIVIIGTLLSFSLYMQGVSDIGPGKASMIACVEPVSAVVFSALWMNTKFQILDYIGFVLITATVFLLSEKDKKNGKV